MREKMMMFVLVAVSLATSATAHAALGEGPTSVEADGVSMKAQRRILAHDRYRLQELQMSSGTIVREYLTTSGRVFAVAWQGPQMPDLELLLGRHFASYREAAKGPRKGRGPRTVESGEVVVQSGGHMRAFVGRAYLPRLMPDGVSIGEIR